MEAIFGLLYLIIVILFFFIFILITLGDKIESIGDIIYNNDFIYLIVTSISSKYKNVDCRLKEVYTICNAPSCSPPNNKGTHTNSYVIDVKRSGRGSPCPKPPTSVTSPCIKECPHDCIVSDWIGDNCSNIPKLDNGEFKYITQTKSILVPALNGGYCPISDTIYRTIKCEGPPVNCEPGTETLYMKDKGENCKKCEMGFYKSEKSTANCIPAGWNKITENTPGNTKAISCPTADLDIDKLKVNSILELVYHPLQEGINMYIMMDGVIRIDPISFSPSIDCKTSDSCNTMENLLKWQPFLNKKLDFSLTDNDGGWKIDAINKNTITFDKSNNEYIFTKYKSLIGDVSKYEIQFPETFLQSSYSLTGTKCAIPCPRDIANLKENEFNKFTTFNDGGKKIPCFNTISSVVDLPSLPKYNIYGNYDLKSSTDKNIWNKNQGCYVTPIDDTKCDDFNICPKSFTCHKNTGKIVKKGMDLSSLAYNIMQFASLFSHPSCRIDTKITEEEQETLLDYGIDLISIQPCLKKKSNSNDPFICGCEYDSLKCDIEKADNNTIQGGYTVLGDKKYMYSLGRPDIIQKSIDYALTNFKNIESNKSVSQYFQNMEIKGEPGSDWFCKSKCPTSTNKDSDIKYLKSSFIPCILNCKGPAGQQNDKYTVACNGQNELIEEFTVGDNGKPSSGKSSSSPPPPAPPPPPPPVKCPSYCNTLPCGKEFVKKYNCPQFYTDPVPTKRTMQLGGCEQIDKPGNFLYYQDNNNKNGWFSNLPSPGSPRPPWPNYVFNQNYVWRFKSNPRTKIFAYSKEITNNFMKSCSDIFKNVDYKNYFIDQTSYESNFRSLNNQLSSIIDSNGGMIIGFDFLNQDDNYTQLFPDDTPLLKTKKSFVDKITANNGQNIIWGKLFKYLTFSKSINLDINYRSNSSPPTPVVPGSKTKITNLPAIIAWYINNNYYKLWTSPVSIIDHISNNPDNWKKYMQAVENDKKNKTFSANTIYERQVINLVRVNDQSPSLSKYIRLDLWSNDPEGNDGKEGYLIYTIIIQNFDNGPESEAYILTGFDDSKNNPLITPIKNWYGCPNDEGGGLNTECGYNSTDYNTYISKIKSPGSPSSLLCRPNSKTKNELDAYNLRPKCLQPNLTNSTDDKYISMQPEASCPRSCSLQVPQNSYIVIKFFMNSDATNSWILFLNNNLSKKPLVYQYFFKNTLNKCVVDCASRGGKCVYPDKCPSIKSGSRSNIWVGGTNCSNDKVCCVPFNSNIKCPTAQSTLEDPTYFNYNWQK